MKAGNIINQVALVLHMFIAQPTTSPHNSLRFKHDHPHTARPTRLAHHGLLTPLLLLLLLVLLLVHRVLGDRGAQGRAARDDQVRAGPEHR